MHNGMKRSKSRVHCGNCNQQKNKTQIKYLVVLLLVGSDLTSFLVDLVREILGWWSALLLLLLLLVALLTSLVDSMAAIKRRG